MLYQRACAYHEHPYPYISQSRLLEPTLTKHASRPQKSQPLLNAGYHLCQDRRKFLFDGAPSASNLYGLDISPAFYDLGFKVFRDRHKFDAKFVSADLIGPAQGIPALDGKIDGISAFGVFYLFRLMGHKVLACRLVGFTKPIGGSTVAGRRLEVQAAGFYDGFMNDTTVYMHNMETFQQFWDDVGVMTNSKWLVDMDLRQLETKVSNLRRAMPPTTTFQAGEEDDTSQGMTHEVVSSRESSVPEDGTSDVDDSKGRGFGGRRRIRGIRSWVGLGMSWL